MKLNELVCPTCDLKCMTDASYTTCASCQTFFYACQSKTVNLPKQNPNVTIIWPTIIPQPDFPTVWVETGDPPPYTTVSTVVTTDQSEYQVWN
jgi:hypothetical protein